MSYNAWLYVYGNPVVFIDPSGQLPAVYQTAHAIFMNENNNPPDVLAFTNQEVNLIETALRRVAIAYARGYSQWYFSRHLGCPPRTENLNWPMRMNATTAFLLIHRGKITFYKGSENRTYPGNTLDWHRILINWGRNGRYFFSYSDDVYMRFIVHEVGHAFNNAFPLLPNKKKLVQSKVQEYSNLLTPDVDEKNGFYDTQEPFGWQRRADDITNQYELAGEIFADQFIGWVYNKWETENGVLKPHGQQRRDFMDRNMPEWIGSLLDPRIER